MAYSNGVITRPIIVGPSQNDIASALGISSNDPAYLIANGNINPWAKYKPVRLNTLADTGESSTEYPTYWQAHDGGCGFSIPTNTNPGAGPETYSGAWYKLLHSSLLWTYQKPTGPLTTWPYRTNDFDGYDHNALPIFAQQQQLTLMLNVDGSLDVPFQMNMGDSRSLSLEDIKINSVQLSSWYFGVLIYYTNNQYVFKATQLAGEFNGIVNFTGMSSYAGKAVSIVPFLSSVSQNQGTAGSGTIISCNLAPVQMNVVEYSSGISVIWDEATWNQAHTEVSYAISLYNSRAGYQTIPSIVITLQDGTQTLWSRTISNVYIAGNDTVVLATGTIPVQNYDSSKQYFMSIVSPNTAYIQYQVNYIEDYPEL